MVLVPITHLASDALPELVAEAISSEGAVIVDRLASTELMDQIAAELAPYMDATPTGPDDFSGNRTRRTGSLIARSAASRELVMHPLALATTKVLLSHVTNF